MRLRSQGVGTPRCHFFNSFFINKLYRDDGKYKYTNVRRWTLPNKLKGNGQVGWQAGGSCVGWWGYVWVGGVVCGLVGSCVGWWGHGATILELDRILPPPHTHTPGFPHHP